MRQQVLASLAASTLACSVCPAQNQLWLTQFGTSQPDYARDIAPDGEGGAIVAGHTEGELGGPSTGPLDVFLARFDDQGNQLWASQFGSPQADVVNALAFDGAGGVVVGGETDGSLGGPFAGGVDAFLARFDLAGNHLWTRQFGTGAFDYVSDIASDGAGGVVVTGSVYGSSLTYEVFLARYDSIGNRLWYREFGAARGDDRGQALASDGVGGAFLGGQGHDLGGPTTGSGPAFIARYDSTGNAMWIRQFGTGVSFQESVGALASDDAGGVIVVGTTWGNLGGPIVGERDIFLARYDGAGNQLWIRQFGTSERELPHSLLADGVGGVVIAGSTTGNLGGPSLGENDAFLVRYDSAGNQLWIHQFGTSDGDYAYGLAPDGVGGAMVAGFTGGSLGGPSAGREDAWIAHYSINSCYADCDKSTGPGILDIFDFLCFQNSFVNAEPYACDCDTSTGPATCDVFDFLCFQDAFVAGCP